MLDKASRTGHCPYLLFVVLVAEEGLLALGAHKVLHMPLLAQRSDHSLLDWSSAGATDGDAHFVVAAQAVQLALDLASAGRQLDAARLAVEVIRVVGLALCLPKHKQRVLGGILK